MTDKELVKYHHLMKLSNEAKALLFDVDGTLVNNIWAHKAAYVETASEYGIQLDDTLIDETAGWPTVAVAEEISRRYNVVLDIESFSKRKSAIFIEKFVYETQPVNFVRQVLIDNVGIKKIGIVSGGSRSTLNITLDVVDVSGKYEALVCAGDTEKGKPSPDPFLLCARLLDVSPHECLVFEDGDPGVTGAIAAGMSWVRIDQL
ncbi:HAD family hydrolase [Sphingobacterium faecale]|uniref:HAD family phosphatase n=1 Tax=Sphingobacterium faecale TaxID=2803775 RepID=A0ABS1R350_9SPHI|nr:HAD family phosphatase [Sphingobacterium faecale]MBL1409137.1 HAD family phosphatase [Sphingobacterium faecale]